MNTGRRARIGPEKTGSAPIGKAPLGPFDPAHLLMDRYAAFLMRLSRTAYSAVSKGRTGKALSKSASVNA